MAINKNHEFEELNGVKCAIVEKNASAERVAFLKEILEQNKYTTVVVASPPPKVVAAPKPVIAPEESTQQQTEPQPLPPPLPETFTIGVTDVTFNPVNAIFGRLLHKKNGQVITLAYWYQRESEPGDEAPYYEIKESNFK
jgi:hypothetical protein